MPIGPITNRFKNIFIIAALATSVFVVYWQVQNFEFVNFDDPDYVTSNYRIQSGITLKSITDAFSDIHTSNWHPVTMISHMLDWQLFAAEAGGHHWTSLLIHIFNTALLFLLINKLTGALWRSALVAALFAVHPINVESVAWVSERKNVLSTFFWILTMLMYVWYVKQPNWKRYLPVFLCFALGLMSKPMLVTLPFALLLIDYWPLKRTAINVQHENQTEIQASFEAGKTKIWFLILEKIPLFILTALSICVTIYAAHNAGAIAHFENITLVKRISNVLVSYVLYLKKLLWPSDLAVFYPFTEIQMLQVLSAVALLVIITAFSCIYFKKYPYLVVGWFWYLGTLVPVIGIVQVGDQAMADRYAYVPFIGLFIIIVWGMFDILKEKISEKVMIAASLVTLALFMFITHTQVKSWENNVTLYNHEIKTAKQNVLPYKNLGLHYIDNNQPEEAIYYFNKAIEFKRNDSTLHNSLGVAFAMAGKYVEAEEQYKTAIILNPVHARAHNNLGMVLLQQSKTDEALKHFQEAIKLQPQFANAHYQSAKIYKQKGLDTEADSHYREAVRLNPGFKEIK